MAMKETRQYTTQKAEHRTDCVLRKLKKCFKATRMYCLKNSFGTTTFAQDKKNAEAMDHEWKYSLHRQTHTQKPHLTRHHILNAFLHGLTRLRPDENINGVHLRARAQEFLHQHLSHEARRPRYQHILLSVPL